MRRVVSNTTPILALLKIGKLEILQQLYGSIIIPYEVFLEIEAGSSKSSYINLQKLDWIKIERVRNPKSLGFFLDLDKGEAEAIVLASELEADLILLDEKLARFHAKHIGIPVSGTAGVLLKAKQFGYFTAIKPLLFELRAEGIWLSDEFIAQMIEMAGE